MLLTLSPFCFIYFNLQYYCILISRCNFRNIVTIVTILFCYTFLQEYDMDEDCEWWMDAAKIASQVEEQIG